MNLLTRIFIAAALVISSPCLYAQETPSTSSGAAEAKVAPPKPSADRVPRLPGSKRAIPAKEDSPSVWGGVYGGLNGGGASGSR